MRDRKKYILPVLTAILLPMKDPKKYTVPVLAAMLLTLVLLICLETFVVPVDWIGTHHAIQTLIVLTCLQPFLLWEERQWQDERERKCSNDECERKRSN